MIVTDYEVGIEWPIGQRPIWSTFNAMPSSFAGKRRKPGPLAGMGEGSDGSFAFGQRGSATRYRVARKDGPHRHLEGARPRPAYGAAPQHRQSWSRGVRRSRP